MNVAELIEELRKYPALSPVRISTLGGDQSGVYEIVEELKGVSFQGNHIRLEAD